MCNLKRQQSLRTRPQKCLINNQSYLLVGHISKAHGIRGELFVHLYNSSADWLDSVEYFYWIKNSQTIKLPLTAKRFHKNGLIVKSEVVLDRTQADGFKGGEIWLSESYLQTEEGSDYYLSELLGFKVWHQGRGVIGQVQSFIDNKVQDLVVVRGPSKTYEIPYVKEFIIDVDFTKKLLSMDFPEGLLEL